MTFNNNFFKNIEYLINIPSDLIIYSNTINTYYNNFDLLIKLLISENYMPPNPPRTISFFIISHELNYNTGMQIVKLLQKLVKNKIKFFIYPLPPCLFKNSNLSLFKKIKFNITIVPPVFFNEQAIMYASTKETIDIINSKQAIILERCQSCVFQKNKQCGGIYQINAPPLLLVNYLLGYRMK